MNQQDITSQFNITNKAMPSSRSSRPLSTDSSTTKDEFVIELKPTYADDQLNMKRKKATNNEPTQSVFNQSSDFINKEEMDIVQSKIDELIRDGILSKDEILRLKKHEEDMIVMNKIIETSEREEKLLKKQVGEQAFSGVSVYNRNLKRNAERDLMKKLLNKIERRAVNTKFIASNTVDSKRGGHNSSESATPKATLKTEWIEASKDRARKNYVDHVQKQMIQDITLQAQIKQENIIAEYKQLLDKNREELSQVQNENSNLRRKVTNIEDEVQSLQYTIQMLKSKNEKQSQREIESQEKLKLFTEYEPLFKELKEKFNFKNPKQVIKRMEMLEKAQADSYTQLLEAQEQKNQMERTVDETRKKEEEKSHKLVQDLYEKTKKVERQNALLNENLISLQMERDKLEMFKSKYLNLNQAVMDLYNTWIKDIEKLGHRNMIIDEEKDIDFTNSDDLISSLKNILIAFTPSKATDEYKQFSKLSNSYWIKYFNADPNLKSKPKLIFANLSTLLDKQNQQIEKLKKQMLDVQNQSKMLHNQLEETKKLKNMLQSELHTRSAYSWMQQEEDIKPKLISRPSTASLKKNVNHSRPSTAKRVRPSTAPANRPKSVTIVPTTTPASTQPLLITKTENSFFLTQIE